MYQNVFCFVFVFLNSSIKNPELILAWFHVRMWSSNNITNNFVRFVSNQTLNKQGKKMSCGQFMLTNVKLQDLQKQAKNKSKWLVSEVTGHPSVKKTKLLLEWPPTIELEMRKTPNYLQLTCVAWTNGHQGRRSQGNRGAFVPPDLVELYSQPFSYLYYWLPSTPQDF